MAVRNSYTYLKYANFYGPDLGVMHVVRHIPIFSAMFVHKAYVPDIPSLLMWLDM